MVLEEDGSPDVATSGEDLMLCCNMAEKWKEERVYAKEGDYAGAGLALH